MKNLAFLIITVLVIGACTGCSKPKAEDTIVLTINDIQSDPMSFTGTVTITGVAASLSDTDATYFGIVDTDELLTCKNLNCGAFMLDAKYEGEQSLPQLADMLNVKGSFVSTDDGFYFAVTEIEIRKNIMHMISK